MLLHLLPLASLLASAPSDAPRTALVLPPAIAAVDTGSQDPATTTVISPDLLTHYIALKKDLLDYWKAPANKALHDSAMAKHHVHTLTLNVTGVQTPSMPANAFDYVDLTAREPAIAAIFKKNSFDPAQFENTQLAVMRAGFASQVAKMSGKTVDDAASVAGKNDALVASHQQELVAVGGVVPLQAGGGGGGGGGGSDDLNP